MFFDAINGLPIAIKTGNSRDFYLVSINGLTPADTPSEFQEYQRKVAQLQVYRIKAALQWMEATGNDVDAAEQWIKDLRDRTDFALRLPPEARAEVEKLNNQIGELADRYPIAIATLMMRNRLALHLIVAEDVLQGSESVVVQRAANLCDRQIADGARFRTFNGTTVVANQAFRNNGVLNCQPLTQSLVAGEPLFLIEADESYTMGWPGWTETLTASKLSISSCNGPSQIDQIYQFYRAEGNGEKKPQLNLDSP